MSLISKINKKMISFGKRQKFNLSSYLLATSLLLTPLNSDALNLKHIKKNKDINTHIVTGYDGDEFDFSKDTYDFPNWVVTDEDYGNDFLDLVESILNSVSKKTVNDIQIEEYFPISPEYAEIRSRMDNYSFGMSASSILYFEDPLYFISDGSGQFIETHNRNLNDKKTAEKIRNEQKKYPLFEFAKAFSPLWYLGNINLQINWNLYRDLPALLILEDSQQNTHSVVAYGIEEMGLTKNVLIYDPTHPNTPKKLFLDSTDNSFIYEDYDNLFTFYTVVVGSNLALWYSLEDFKRKVNNDLINNNQDQFCIFPSNHSSKKDNELNYLITDINGRRYGYDEGNFFNELQIEEKNNGNIKSLLIPSSLDYSIHLSNIPGATTNISFVNSGTNEQEISSYYNIQTGNISEATLESNRNYMEITNPLNQNQFISPTFYELNKDYYDVNGDGLVNYLDLFSLSNNWNSNPNGTLYNSNFLLKSLE